MSAIEWTDRTWNPIAGCSRVGPGCEHCYAIIQAARCDGFGHKKYAGTVGRINGRLDWTGKFSFDPKALNIPRGVRKPTIWFVNSMSDLFGEGVSDDQIKAIFAVMNETPQHTYQVLTKRANRALKLAPQLNWTPNIWMGVSIESDAYIGRARLLSKIPAALRFISAEPLLDSLPSLDLTGIGWVIVGGESGNATTIRPMDPAWVRSLRDRIRAAGVPFFFKQWGAYGPDGVKRPKGDNGHLLDGQELFEMPPQVRKAMASRPQLSPKPASTATILPFKPVVSLTTIQPSRIAYRSAILARLQTGPLDAGSLRAANGATTRPASNLHAWALVDLQRTREITKRRDGRYGLLLKAIAQ